MLSESPHDEDEKIRYTLGEVFANLISDKGPVYLEYVETSQNSTEKNNPIRKWAKDTKRHFSEGDSQMANKHVKICSTSLATGKYKLKP